MPISFIATEPASVKALDGGGNITNFRFGSKAMGTCYISREACITEAKCILTTAVCVCICLYLCLSLAAFLHYCTDPDITCGNSRGCPLVGGFAIGARFLCYDNIHICKIIALYTANTYSAEREMPASACTRYVAGCSRGVAME